MDKTKLLEILNDWNYWHNPLPNTYKRGLYAKKIDYLSKMDEVLVIKGVRRSGKSTLMINRIKRLIKDGMDVSNILFINLEDPRFINHLDLELLDSIKEIYLENLAPKKKPYIFLDEIQNIPNWEKWINREFELKSSNIVISGSNSSMLSSEIASTLSGRYVSLEVFVLGFKEFLEFKELKISSRLDFVSKKIEVNRAFEEYLRYGGFPQIVKYDKDMKRELLISYKDSILLKDIVARYSLNEYKKLEEITAYILSNSGISLNANRIKKLFSISYDMASSYLEYLLNAYMIFEVRKFDYSFKKQLSNDKKYYPVDLGLSNIFKVANLQNRGALLENLVFLELKRRGYEIYYYKTKNSLECDFLIEKDGKIAKLIQVTSSIKDESTKKRELKVFKKTIEELGLKDIESIVLSEDSSQILEQDGIEIEVKNIVEWLLLH